MKIFFSATPVGRCRCRTSQCLRTDEDSLLEEDLFTVRDLVIWHALQRSTKLLFEFISLMLILLVLSFLLVICRPDLQSGYYQFREILTNSLALKAWKNNIQKCLQKLINFSHTIFYFSSHKTILLVVPETYKVSRRANNMIIVDFYPPSSEVQMLLIGGCRIGIPAL